MKDFIKSVSATLVGVFIFFFGLLFIGLIGIIGIAASDSTPVVEKNSVLVLKLKGTVVERNVDQPFTFLKGTDNATISLETVLQAIKSAKNNDNIKGIYIENNGFSAYPAQLEELRRSLKNFKESKKWIVTYADWYDSYSYYVASVSDHIYMNPQGNVAWHGLGAESMYFKDALAKIGVRVVPVKVGKYKSAVEMFTESGRSDADREQTQRYLNKIWGTWLNDVSESRHIPKDSLNIYADRYMDVSAPHTFVKNKMVDGLFFADEIKEKVREMLNLEKDDDIPQVTPEDLLRTVAPDEQGEKIAVYYASGDIVDTGTPSGLLSGKEQIVGDDVCRDMEELKKDDDIKAVVLRINSGGGSAFASEKMWHYIKELRKVKPVVVSMSGMAASGGYYMSCAANWIVAEPTTLTGSIGIFGLIPDASELLNNKLGIKFDEVKTNKFSTLGATGRAITPDELALIQSNVNRGYQLFLSRVSEGRKIPMSDVERIAQGHVYVGSDAKELKLVDQIGGLDVAIAKAAQLAKLKAHHVTTYPEQISFIEQLLAISNKENYLDDRLREMMGSFYEPFAFLSRIQSQDRIQARMPYVILLH